MGNLTKIQNKTAGKLKLSNLTSTNLSTNEKKLLVNMFNESPSFNLNQKYYSKKLDVSVITIKRLYASLTTKGYLLVTQLAGYNNYNYTVCDDGSLINEKLITITTPTIDINAVLYIVNDIIDEHFPSMPANTFLDYINTVKEAIQSGKVTSIEILNKTNIIKSISKIYTEPVEDTKVAEVIPTKLSLIECEEIIKNKMIGGTINQRGDTVKKVKEWFINNDCVATEDEIKNKTFKIHNDSKTSGRVLDQRYQD